MSLPRAFAALSGASLVSMAAQLVRGKLAALFLGPAGVGILNQLSLLWNLFQIGGSLGAANGIIQHGAEALAGEGEPAMRQLVSTSTLLLGLFSVVLAALGIAFAPRLSALLLHDNGAHGSLVALILVSVPLGVTAQLYRSLLSAAREVRALVKVQIVADTGAAILFAALIVPLGISGAILGFMATHLFTLILAMRAASRRFGIGLLLPRPSSFRWSVVRSNLGFGASGLVMIALSNLSVLLVSTLVIGRLGLDANGWFGNGWRIASVYLGAVTAATLSYYLPTLTRCADDRAMALEVNATLRFYMLLLPPLMAVIMAGGPVIVWLILSDRFAPVAGLLLLFVPAELFRVLAETLSVPFLARRRMLPFTLLFGLQAALFVAAAALLLPRFGLAGAAAGYGVGTVAGAVATYVAARRGFSFALERSSLGMLARALALLAVVGTVCAYYPIGVTRVVLCAVAIGLWLALASRQPAARAVIDKGWARIRPAARSHP